MATEVTFPHYKLGTPISAMIDGRLCLGQIAAQVSIDPPVYWLRMDDGRDLECSLFSFAPMIGHASVHGRGPGRVLFPLMAQVTRKSDGARGLVSGYCFDYQGPDQTRIKEYAVWFRHEAARGPRNYAPSELIAVKDEQGHLIVQSRWE